MCGRKFCLASKKRNIIGQVLLHSTGTRYYVSFLNFSKCRCAPQSPITVLEAQQFLLSPHPRKDLCEFSRRFS